MSKEDRNTPFFYIIFSVHCNLCIPGANGSLLLDLRAMESSFLDRSFSYHWDMAPVLASNLFLYHQGNDPLTISASHFLQISKGNEASPSSEAPRDWG